MATKNRRRAVAVLAPLVIGVLGTGLGPASARAETVPVRSVAMTPVSAAGVSDASTVSYPSTPAPDPTADPALPAPALGDHPGNAPRLCDWWW